MPFPNYHACRVESPDKFDPDSFRTKPLKPGNPPSKSYMIVGKYKSDPSGPTHAQTFRLHVKEYSKNEARKFCERQKGQFEVAAKTKEVMVDPLGLLADYRHRAFPMSGEHVMHSHHAIHHQWQAEDSERFGVCENYEERDFILTHQLIVAEMHRRGIEHHYTDDLDHTLPLYLKQESTGYEGEVITDYTYDICGEVVAISTEDTEGLIDQIPISKGVDMKKLTDGDKTPFFVAVRSMRVGKSRNNRMYSDEIVGKFQALHPMPGYESHQHVDRPIFGGHPGMFHPVTAWIGALRKGDELFSKGYIRPEEGRLIRSIEMAHAIGKGMVVSITGKVEQVLKKDDEGEYWEILDIADGTIDWYQPTATPGIPGAGSLSIKKGKSAGGRSGP